MNMFLWGVALYLSGVLHGFGPRRFWHVLFGEPKNKCDHDPVLTERQFVCRKCPMKWAAGR